MIAINTRSRRVPSTLPSMAPRIEGEMPCDVCDATVGTAAVEEEELDDKLADELAGRGEPDVAGKDVVGARVIVELTGVEVGVAEVGVKVVDGGGVRPP